MMPGTINHINGRGNNILEYNTFYFHYLFLICNPPHPKCRESPHKRTLLLIIPCLIVILT